MNINDRSDQFTIRTRIAARLARASGTTQLPPFVWWLTIGALVKFVATFVTPFTGLYLQRFFGSPVPEIGLVLAVYAVGTLIGFPLFGLAIDRFGSPLVIVGGALLETTLLLALSIVNLVWEFAVLFLMLGFLSAGFRPAYQNITAQICPDADRPRAYALFSMAWNLSAGLAVIVGGSLFALAPTAIFAVDAVANLSAAIFFATFLFGKLPRQQSMEPSRIVTNVLTPPDYVERQLWQDVPFLKACTCLFLVECVRAQTISTFPIYLKEVYGLTAAQYGLCLGTGCLVLVVFSLPVNAALKQIDRRVVVTLGAITMCGAYALAPWHLSFPFALLIVVITTSGQMLVHPALIAMVMARAPARHRGKYLGVYYAASSLAWAVAPVIGTWIYADVGANALWLGCSSFGVVVAAIQLKRYRKQS